MRKRTTSFLLTLFALAPTFGAPPVASYQEIPYYLRQLQETQLENKRMECNKIIHDAIVNADLSDKRTVKKMGPIIDKVRIAMDSGFDRAYLEGSSMWLGSAVEYFEREKLRRTVLIPQADWMPVQTTAINGAQISIYPNKILIHQNEKTRTVAESAGIHEAVISPDAKRVAFFRKSDEATKAEVWLVNLKTMKREKLATLPSCATILFSLDGGHLFIQEEPADGNKESAVHRISSGGGSLKQIGTVRTMDAIVSKGKNKGALIVYRLNKHHLGTSQQECPFAWTSSGKEIGRLKDVPCR